MPQKVVIKFPTKGEKNRCKAVQLACRFSGIDSVTLVGEDENQIEVIGDGFDAVALTELFRRKMGYSELVSVGPVPEDDGGGGGGGGGDKKENKAEVQIPAWGYPYAYGQPAYMHEMRDEDPKNCSIM